MQSQLKFGTESSYEKSFIKALNNLNPGQKKAVEHIFGSVLVLAGPGTGKTQLLATRIGYILSNTDTNASEILCLTYTDAGAVAMRKRLLEFIGPEAYNLSIYTFHSFCNKVINENMEYFGTFYDLQAISELEKVQIVTSLIDEFSDDNPLKRFKGMVHYDRTKLENLFSTMKKEAWSEAHVLERCDQYLESLKNDPDYFYKKNGKGYKKGDFKVRKFEEQESKMLKLKAAARELKNYNKKLQSSERFDFDDMILWVVDSFRTNEDLLRQYQERYQFFLIDEYQDTNGSQNELIDLLASYWEDPNLFVVGDDDQAIYRFQGANMQSILDFQQKYNPDIIFLEDNYRSDQKILDIASSLIDYNSERIGNHLATGIEKKLIEKRDKTNVSSPDPQLLKFANITAEDCYIAKEIERAHLSGRKLSEIAVLYRKHANVGNVVKYLQQKNIPLNIKRRVNILTTPEIERILTILRYIDQESKRVNSAHELLFEILHYEYFGLRARDIGLISIHAYYKLNDSESENLNWSSYIDEPEKLRKIGIQKIEETIKWIQAIQTWIQDSRNYTLQVLLEKILTEGNILHTVMNSHDKVWRLQLVNSFFDFVKAESVKKPDLSIGELIEYVDLMNANNIQLPFEKIISNENGVHFITTHSAKGLEFEKVFLIHCESDTWESQRKPNRDFSYPPSLIPESSQGNIEDERRLFFVAMTRAKDNLIMSYSASKDEGKALEPSRFLSEAGILPREEETKVNDEIILEFKSELMRYQTGEVELIDHSLIDRVLQDFRMSVTGLNKYLDCPLKFYFENILRIPQARNVHMGFGRAIHYALEQFVSDIEQQAEVAVPGKNHLLDHFETGMEKNASHFTKIEFKDLNTYGKKILSAYFDFKLDTWKKPAKYKLEYKIEDVEYRGIPIRGVLDMVSIAENSVEVSDYKTGKPKNSRKKLKPPLGDEDKGGDYWRQIVFYNMLISSDPFIEKPFERGYMEYIEPDDNGNFKSEGFSIENFELDIVYEQLKDSYDRIHNHEFSQGCNDKDCKWCNFVNNHFRLETSQEDFEEDR